MNILIPDSWLREYLETNATPAQIKDCLSLCGPSVERVEKKENDFVYEIEITTNRIDMVSLYGIAREASAILPRFGIKAKLKPLNIPEIVPPGSDLPLTIRDPGKLCDRILAVVLDNVEPGSSPANIKERLERSGVRSLNNIIDITNYVMLELGHPTHVFDYDRIKAKTLLIRKAKENETLITLDDKKCVLAEDDVIIDDGTGIVIDLPGIMGTRNSVVTPATKRIIFFIESNDPVNIRRTSMRLGLRSMAATINEKHPDPTLARISLLRGIELYRKLAKATVASRIMDIYPHPSKPKHIFITKEFINIRLGVELKNEDIARILKSLFFNVEILPNGNLKIAVPAFRQFDVAIGEDIVEEVARLYGYHNLPARLMAGAIPVSKAAKDFNFEYTAKNMLKYWGYTEIYGYSFVPKSLIEKAGLNLSDHLKVSNPLTPDFEYMRTSLIPTMLEVMNKNQHFEDTLSLFELAKIYRPETDSLPDERPMLLMANQTGFYAIKGVVTSLLSELGVSGFSLAGEKGSFWHPKQAFNYSLDGKILARVGKLNPHLKENFTIKKDVFMGEINLRIALEYAKQLKKYIPIPNFPPVIEDWSLVYSKGTKIGPMIEEIQKNKLIAGVEIIDRMENRITFRIRYISPHQSLSAEEVVAIRTETVKRLDRKFGVHLRK